MKKLLVSVVAIAFVFASCGKDDVTAPVITVPTDALVMDLGDNAAALKDVTAKDDQDGDLATANIQIQGLDFVGKSTLTYSIADKAENVGTAKREVTIKADKLFGGYAVVEKNDDNGTSMNYDVQVVKSGTSQTDLLMNNFYGYDNVKFSGTGNSTTLTMEEYKAVKDGENFAISGSASYKKGTTQYEIVTVTFKVVWDEPTWDDDNFTMTFSLR